MIDWFCSHLKGSRGGSGTWSRRDELTIRASVYFAAVHLLKWYITDIWKIWKTKLRTFVSKALRRVLNADFAKQMKQ